MHRHIGRGLRCIQHRLAAHMCVRASVVSAPPAAVRRGGRGPTQLHVDVSSSVCTQGTVPRTSDEVLQGKE